MQQSNNKTMTSIEQKQEEFWRTMSSNKFIIEATKCCGYSDLIVTYKERSLVDLHRDIFDTFICVQETSQLYVLHKDVNITEKLTIPKDFILTTRSFIANNPDYFSPIYSLPSPVVYRIYLDDGHSDSHFHENCNTHK